MRLPNSKYLIAGAAIALLSAGVAEAATAKLHTMNVAAPDGSIVEVRYTGDVAPRVQVVPATSVQDTADAGMMMDPFIQMQRVSAMMDAQMHAMMQRAAMMQQQAAQMQQQVIAASAHGQQGMPEVTTVAGTVPQGVHMTYVSTTTDANGCTRTVSYSSDGSGAAPKLIKASSDTCEAAGKSAPAAIPAKAEVPAHPVDQPAPGTKV